MSIHIKPSHRGRLTALKKRTGKTEAELYKTGSPATRKMITFARNARKWKHSDGGNLFAYGSPIHIRDYGMEWNNKLDRLSAYNNLISQFGQRFGGMADMANGNGSNVADLKKAYSTDNSTKGSGFDFNPNAAGIDGMDSMKNINFMNFAACGGKLRKCGGKLFDYGGDFSNGLTMYNTGGTHEENPYEGVQVGTDNEGTPNLVEEGEVRYQDYIFSNRLSLNEEMAEKYNIPKKYIDTTFAYAAEKLGEESKERQEDPISKRTLNAYMERLKGAQEEVKAIKAQEEMMQQVQQIADELGVSPEDVIAGMQMQQEEAAQQEAMAQQQVMQQQIVTPQKQQMPQDENAMIESFPYAYGGTLLKDIPPGTQRDNTRVANVGVTYKQLEENAPYMLKKAINDEKDRYHAEGLALDWERTFYPEKPIPPFYKDEIWLGNYTKHKKNLDSIKRVYSFPPEFSQPAPKKNALGGTLFDYQGMEFSNPQRSQRLNNSLPNKFDDGGKTNRLLTSKKLSQAELWNKYTKKSLDEIVSRFEKEYNAAKTPEEKAELRREFIQKFNAIQESYARMYQEGVDPRVANEIVKQHQTDFDTFGGNTGYTGIEADLNMPGRTILKDTTNAKFTPDGYRQVITDTRNLGSNLYDPSMMEYYNTLNERLHKSGINYGLLDRDSMRYKFNGKQNELYGLSEYNPEVVSESEEEPRSIYDNVPMSDNTPTYTSYESIGETTPKSSTTTSSNNPQSPEQRTGEQQKVYNTAPKYSMLDFVPLWQYLTAGKPDYSQADALVNYTNRMPKPTYKPIGDFVQYHPFDRQYASNQLRAQSAATRRNNVNLSAGNRGNALASNLAANMQAQFADAAMQRQADEANLAQRLQVAQFNRGTNQFNAEAFNRLELQRPYAYQLGLQARAQRANLHNAIDNAYSAAKSTNLNTFLNNMYNRKREAQDRAQLEWLADRGYFGTGANTNPFLTNDYSFWDWLSNGNWRKFNKNE